MAQLAKVPRLRPNDYTLSKIQDNLANQVDQISSVPFLSGTWFRNVSVTSGQAFTLNHNFGRPYQGYWVTRSQSAACTLKDNPGSATITSQISLTPTATATIDIWVF